jgi:hypothetical protein
VLVMTRPTFDFPASVLPSNVRYVGPQLDDPDWATGEDWRPVGDGPLVLVDMSSVFQSRADALRRVADGLGRPRVRAVLTTGPAVRHDAARMDTLAPVATGGHIAIARPSGRRNRPRLHAGSTVRKAVADLPKSDGWPERGVPDGRSP